MLNGNGLSLLAACAVALGGVAVSAPVAAQERSVVVTAPDRTDIIIRWVSYRDLNLTTSDGEKRLFRRVGYAVNDICHEVVGISPHLYGMGCRKEAWGGARPQIARAVQRARDIAQFGSSAIPPVAIAISFTAN